MTKATRNLLVIMADEHRRDAMGCMGHGVVKTPNLDALAARGTVFDNAYTPSPICVPARAALATGQYVHRTGNWDSAAPYDGNPKSWMHAVRDSGAETFSFGKLHFRGTSDDNGFTHEVLPMHVHEGRGWTVGLLREEPPQYDATQGLAADVGAGETEYSAYDRAVTRQVESWLASCDSTTKPWAAFVSLVTPHYPLCAPQEFLDLYDDVEIPEPIGHGDTAAPDHPELAHLAEFYDYARHFEPDGVSKAQAAYFALVSFMDDCVGRVLAALRTSGQEDDTLIIYVSDHGEMLGDHGFWTKSVMFEGSVGVPMILAGPQIPAGHRVQTPASLVDIAPTAAGLFGDTAFQDGLPGESLVDLAGAPDRPDRTVLSEYHDGGSSTGSFMVRWDRWKYIHYAGMRPQLFDLAADPCECCDLGESSQAEYVTSRDEGLRRLTEICDPESVNHSAFQDQRRRIAELGGPEACRAQAFGHTPAPQTGDAHPLANNSGG